MPAQTRKPTTASATKPTTQKGSTVTTATPSKPAAKPAAAAKRTRNPLPELTIDAASLAASVVESDAPIRQNRSGKNAEHVAALKVHLERSWAARNDKNQGKSMTLPVPAAQAKTVTALLRRAADELGIGVRTVVDGDRVTFAAWQKKAYKPRAAK